MVTSLGIWTLLLILYQTFICTTFSWFTLTCRLSPRSTELREVTLMKLLYLYDPQACGRIHFYNFTLKGNNEVAFTNIMWPVRNRKASDFRGKMRIWLALHIIWLVLSIVNASQSERSSTLYMVLLPFTLTGVAMLAVDAIFAVMFLEDTAHTKTEVEILSYINSDRGHVRWISKMVPLQNIPEHMLPENEDTSWISLIFAYGSCRGVVMWIVNFWMIKDNYFEGLALHRRQLRQKSKLR